MNTFYACLDAGFFKYVPPAMQHLAIADMARKQDGSMAFAVAEDSTSLASKATLMAKLEEKPIADGFIFFTVRQFFYGGDIDIKSMKHVLDSGYELHFARENVSIRSNEDLDDLFPMIYSTFLLLERDESPDYWRPIWEQVH